VTSQGKDLCLAIKNWQEKQQLAASGAPGEKNSAGAINWEDISRDLNAMSNGGSKLTASACQVLWRYLAYGQIVTEADLLGGSVSESASGAGSTNYAVGDGRGATREVKQVRIMKSHNSIVVQ
jgi:hypothetical protein